MKKKTLKIVTLVIALIAIPLLIFGILALTEKTAYQDMLVANLSSSSGTLVVYKDPALQVPFGSPILKLDDRKLLVCSDTENVEPCISKVVDQQRFTYYEIRNLMPSSDYIITWIDTLISRFSNTPNGEALLATLPVDEGAPYIGRVYGRVVDENVTGEGSVLVVVENDSDVINYPFAAITNSDGAYNITYTAARQDNFKQEVEVLTPDGRSVSYTTASFYNRPVADLVVPIAPVASGNFFTDEIVQDTNAAQPNTCVNAKFGGIRAQCNDKVPWVEGLDIENCPTNQTYFRLGLIQHDSVTGFYKPESVVLKLYDTEANEYVKNKETGEELLVRNGGYVDEETMVELELGKKYAIQAFDGERECLNIDSPDPWLMLNERQGAPITNSTAPDFTGEIIPPMMTEANLCKKMGENFAIPFEVGADLINKAVDDNHMRWGEALITSVNDIENYKKSVITGRNEGMNMILRICYKNNCDIDNGTAYGEAIAKVYQELMDSGQLPQDGLFVHVGHNEPNNAEYRDPNEEAQFMADTLAALESAGILSTDSAGVGVKAIGPNLDGFTGDGQWPGGGDDPNPHPIYSASSYLTKMLENSNLASKKDAVYAWALNDYIASGRNQVLSDVSAFSSALSSAGVSSKIFITELGRLDTQMDPNFDLLREVISGLESDSNVEVILLFNSLGANKDPNFDYHAPLWNGDPKVSSLYPNCTKATFNVPQEGSTSATYENGDTSSPDNPNDSGAPVNGKNGGEAAKTYGGYDRCIDDENNPDAPKVCAGAVGGSEPVTWADGGCINCGFNNPFYEDEEGDQVPTYFWKHYSGEKPTFEYEVDGFKIPDAKAGYGPGFASQCSSPDLSPEQQTSCGIGQKIQRGGPTEDPNGGINFLVEGGFRATMDVDYSIQGQDEEDNSKPVYKQTCQGRLGLDVIDNEEDTPPEPSERTEWSDWVEFDASGEVSPKFEKASKSRSGWVSLFTEVKCNKPRLEKGPDTGTAVLNSYNWEADADGVSLFSCVGDNCVLQQGDATSIAVNDVCGSSSSSGQQGDACWDPVIVNVGNSSALPGGEQNDVLGAATLVMPERGKYKLESDDLSFTDPFIYNFTDGASEVPMFQDRDQDGKFDEDEYLVPSALDTKLTKVGEAYEFDLKPGISMISVPFFTDDFDQAVEILEKIKAQGGYATAVASFNNTGSQPGWRSTSARGTQVFGDDYKLEPGDAIYLAVQEPMKLKLSGQDYTTPVQQYVREGWNLIALKGASESIRASELIDSMNEIPGVAVSKVTIWDPSRGRYVSYIEDPDGSEYGENFLIDETLGVFVLVDQGVGYWTPI